MDHRTRWRSLAAFGRPLRCSGAGPRAPGVRLGSVPYRGSPPRPLRERGSLDRRGEGCCRGVARCAGARFVVSAQCAGGFALAVGSLRAATRTDGLEWTPRSRRHRLRTRLDRRHRDRQCVRFPRWSGAGGYCRRAREGLGRDAHYGFALCQHRGHRPERPGPARPRARSVGQLPDRFHRSVARRAAATPHGRG